MSKTYKKAAFADNQKGGAKWAKRQANKAVRRLEGEIPGGFGYIRKAYCSWNIHDRKWVAHTKEEIIDFLKNGSVWSTTGTVSVYRRDPFLYRDKLFSRDSIRKL